ncbi:MAG: flavin monoamine oxidase family protein [Anaerolineae bacterium]
MRIIVIGAGFSGIAAGRTLADAGHEVVVLEGRDRIGGRTHTDSTLGPDIDLGGSWIHGPHGNPLVPLAKEAGATWKWTDFKNVLGDSVMAFDADGTQLDAADYTQGINNYDGALAMLTGSILGEKPDDSVKSMADLYETGLLAQPAVVPLGTAKGHHYTSQIRFQYENAASLEDSAFNVGSYVKLPGGDNLLCGGGFRKVITHLAQGLDIRYSTAVHEIKYGADEVIVATDQGEYSANRCIVSVPLGVLQGGNIIFSPPLPESKAAAIGRIGMGNYEKIALKFPETFWPTEPHRLNYISDHEPPLYNAWLNFAHFTGDPILVCYHGGPMAEYTNGIEDEDLIAGAVEVLKKMFGPNVPDPISYVRTRWSADEFSQGSYSFTKVGQHEGDRDELAKPIAGRLYFAGEATHANFYGTVHGAYESGVRAAREILA